MSRTARKAKRKAAGKGTITVRRIKECANCGCKISESDYEMEADAYYDLCDRKPDVAYSEKVSGKYVDFWFDNNHVCSDACHAAIYGGNDD